MASKQESSEELNNSKYGPSSILNRPLPPIPTVQQPIASSSCTRREHQILAPIQDDRGRKLRDPDSTRSKAPLYFSVPVEQPPTIVTDQEYIARKKTFDIFLKSRDLEFMAGGKSSGQNPRTLERHSSLDQVRNSQSKSHKELKNTLKNKGGKMFTNELWSDGYYVSVINSSHLKKKSEQKSHLMLKPLQQKAQELENLCNTVQASKEKNSSSYFFAKNPSFDVTQTMREAFQPLEFSCLYQAPDASPSSLPKGKSALRSILKNITPRKGSGDKLIGSQSTEINPKDLTPDFSPNFMLSDPAKSFHLPKPYKRPQNLHISFDKKYEEEAMSITSETLSPVVQSKSRRALHTGGFLASISSKFSTAKNHCALSNSSKNSRREKSDEVDTFEVSDTTRHDPGYNLHLKNVPSPPENIEARQKVQQLINQCIDLGQKNKDLEKEVMSTKVDFEAFTTRRQRMRLQKQKTMELTERMNRQTKFIKVLYNQKQGAPS